MKGCIVVAFEDVLSAEGIVQPLFEHHYLYTALASTYRTVVLSTTMGWQETVKFMKVHRLRYDLVRTKEDSVLDAAGWKVAEVREIKGDGWPVAFYLDADPVAYRMVLAEGTSALLLAHRALRPLWLPENRETRAWSEVEAFIDSEREARRSSVPPA